MSIFCNYKLNTVLMNASGCCSSTAKELEELDNTQHCGAVVTKSATLEPQIGNEKPRFFLSANECINAMGLPNEGIDYYNHINIKNKLYIQSIYPKSVEDLEYLLNTKAGAIEVNLSCPNVALKQFEEYEKLMHAIWMHDANKTIGIKMPPLFYSDEFDKMAHLLLKYHIDFITCCNTVPNCLLLNGNETRIYSNDGLGGMSFKPIGLANVYQFYKRLNNKVDIIGSGGIQNGRDVYEYLLCGAKAVQIGTTLLREGTACFERIQDELDAILTTEKVTVKDVIGRVKKCSKL